MTQTVAPERRDQTIDEALVDALTEARVTMAASLPDDWVSALLRRFDESPTIDHVRVAREPEIVGVLAGAFLGGTRAVGVMGATGFLTCACELATLGLKFQIPMFLMVSLRGGPYDTQVFQETQWRTARRMADALDMQSFTLDRPEKLAGLPMAYEALRIHKRPYVAWLSRSLLTNTPVMD